MIKRIMVAAFLLLGCFTLQAQARLTIKNNSTRSMTVKVMRGSSGNGSLHRTANIFAYESKTIYFSQTGNYFTKSKAILNGKVPIYKKGRSFKVINGSEGYSVLTLTFTIRESAVAMSSGETISKTEFDED